MNTLAIMIRCTVGCAFGSSLGIVVIIAGRVEQGLGLAIVGGLLGMTLAISSLLYRTTASETFTRGLLLYLQLLVRKHIPVGEKLVPIRDKDIPGRQPQTANPVDLDSRMLSGMKLGAAATVVPAVLIAVYIRDANPAPDPIAVKITERAVIGFAFVALIGGGCGAAVGALTVPGVHRRNILLGTIVGTSIGIGIATGIAPVAQVPAWQLFCFIGGLFGYVGMAGGMFSGDNFRVRAEDTTEDSDHDRTAEK